MLQPPDTLIGMIGLGFSSRLPLYRHLRISVGGELLWPWRSALFEHNKRRRKGKRKLRMRGRSLRRMNHD